uniref:Uncharacterized protein n=2 Tax=Oryza brachyantha TaxID=4533 RepID=J3M7Q5_ORYBR
MTPRGVAAATTTVCFHEDAVRFGEMLPFYFAEVVTLALRFVPCRVIDSIPFTTTALSGSNIGRPCAVRCYAGLRQCGRHDRTRETVHMFEWPMLAWESKFCTLHKV